MNDSKYNISDEEMASLVEALDNMLDEKEPDFYGELKQCAWNVLLENPGYGFDEWVQTLMEQYPTEVVDALGTNPEEANAALADMWESDYDDPNTGFEQKLSWWAKAFATDESREIYYKLMDSCASLKRLTSHSE